MGAAKKRLRRTLAAAAALIVAVAAGAYYFRFVVPFESTDDAFIEGYVIPIAPQVPGYVAQLLITDNQAVKKGEVLLEIDPRDYEASLAQARADLAAARSQLEQAQAQVTPAKPRLHKRRRQWLRRMRRIERAADDLKRYESVDNSAVSEKRV